MAATDTPPVGRKGDKIVRDALLAALRQDPTQLKKAAEKAWSKAIEGDLPTFKEIADRIDGKVAQPIAGDSENPLEIIQRIERLVVDPANQNT
jgi:hypothetical protein